MSLGVVLESREGRSLKMDFEFGVEVMGKVMGGGPPGKYVPLDAQGCR